MKEPIMLTAGGADTAVPMKDVEEGVVATVIAEVMDTDGVAEAQMLCVTSPAESVGGSPVRLPLCRLRIYQCVSLCFDSKFLWLTHLHWTG